ENRSGCESNLGRGPVYPRFGMERMNSGSCWDRLLYIWQFVGGVCSFDAVLAKPFCHEFGVVCGEQELNGRCSILGERGDSDAEGIAGGRLAGHKPARRICFGGVA